MSSIKLHNKTNDTTATVQAPDNLSASQVYTLPAEGGEILVRKADGSIVGGGTIGGGGSTTKPPTTDPDNGNTDNNQGGGTNSNTVIIGGADNPIGGTDVEELEKITDGVDSFKTPIKEDTATKAAFLGELVPSGFQESNKNNKDRFSFKLDKSGSSISIEGTGLDGGEITKCFGGNLVYYGGYRKQAPLLKGAALVAVSTGDPNNVLVYIVCRDMYNVNLNITNVGENISTGRLEVKANSSEDFKKLPFNDLKDNLAVLNANYRYAGEWTSGATYAVNQVVSWYNRAFVCVKAGANSIWDSTDTNRETSLTNTNLNISAWHELNGVWLGSYMSTKDYNASSVNADKRNAVGPGPFGRKALIVDQKRGMWYVTKKSAMLDFPTTLDKTKVKGSTYEEGAFTTLVPNDVQGWHFFNNTLASDFNIFSSDQALANSDDAFLAKGKLSTFKYILHPGNVLFNIGAGVNGQCMMNVTNSGKTELYNPDPDTMDSNGPWYAGYFNNTHMRDGQTLSNMFINHDLGWLKFKYNGKILYIDRRPSVKEVSYNDLAKWGLTTGTKTIRMGNSLYYVRVIKEDEYKNLIVASSNGKLNNLTDLELDQKTHILDTFVNNWDGTSVKGKKNHKIIVNNGTVEDLDNKSRTGALRLVLEYIPVGEEPYNKLVATYKNTVKDTAKWDILMRNFQYDRYSDTGFYGEYNINWVKGLFADTPSNDNSGWDTWTSDTTADSGSTNITQKLGAYNQDQDNMLMFYNHGNVVLFSKKPRRKMVSEQNILNRKLAYNIEDGNDHYSTILKNANKNIHFGVEQFSNCATWPYNNQFWTNENYSGSYSYAAGYINNQVEYRKTAADQRLTVLGSSATRWHNFAASVFTNEGWDGEYNQLIGRVSEDYLTVDLVSEITRQSPNYQHYYVMGKANKRFNAIRDHGDEYVGGFMLHKNWANYSSAELSQNYTYTGQGNDGSWMWSNSLTISWNYPRFGGSGCYGAAYWLAAPASVVGAGDGWAPVLNLNVWSKN